MILPVEGWALAGAVLAYGGATFLLAQGSTAGVRAALRQPAWMAGVALQAVGFVLSFVARAELPLLVVQPATTASIAVAYLLGAALGRWPVRARDAAGLAMVVTGIAVLARGAQPGPADPPSLPVLAAFAVLLVPCATMARRALDPADATATRRGLALSVMAGTAFGVSAFSARALAGEALAGNPLAGNPFAVLTTSHGLVAAVLLVAGTLIGQLLFTAALSRGGMTGPSAIMHVVETVGPALAGVLVLGDAVRDGYAVAVALALPVALGGCLLLIGSGMARRRPGLDATMIVP